MELTAGYPSAYAPVTDGELLISHWRKHHSNMGIYITIGSFIVVAMSLALFFLRQSQNRSVRAAVRGLGDEYIEDLPTRSYQEADESFRELNCPICLRAFEEGERCIVLPKCSHAFQASCIEMWLRDRATCPICRCNYAPVS